MKLTAIWLWKLRIKFWRRSAAQVFSYKQHPDLRIVSSEKIDREKWNDAITKNAALIFNRFEYLSALTKWDAVVNDDYSLLLPLPYRKKFGIKYYTTAPLTHRLQLIGHADDEQRAKIISLITKKSFFASFYFDPITDHHMTSRINYTLDLNRSFEDINRSFAFNFRSEVKHAEKFNIHYSERNIIEVIDLWRKRYTLPGLRSSHVTAFKELCMKLSLEGSCICRCIFNRGEILAAAILLKDENRIYNIVNVVSEEGRKNSANYLLYHNVIKEFSQQRLLFDFVGSELKGVQEFYKKFRPDTELYYLCSLNNTLALKKVYLLLKRMFSAR